MGLGMKIFGTWSEAGEIISERSSAHTAKTSPCQRLVLRTGGEKMTFFKAVALKIILSADDVFWSFLSQCSVSLVFAGKTIPVKY